MENICTLEYCTTEMESEREVRYVANGICVFFLLLVASWCLGETNIN